MATLWAPSRGLITSERLCRSSVTPSIVRRLNSSSRASMEQQAMVPAVIVGGGRVGSALEMMSGGKDTVVRRGEKIPPDSFGPIFVCTRNDVLNTVFEATPPHRHEDLVFFQNGMLEPWLERKGIPDASQVLVYFAVAKLGDPPMDGKTDTNPEGLTAASGKWAPAVATRLHSAEDYLIEELIEQVFDTPIADDNEVNKTTEKDLTKAFCQSQGGRHYYQLSGMKKQDKDDKSDCKEKKPKPSVGLVPDLVGDQQNVDATELCRAWRKVGDQEVLVFFDPGACATFISPELASKLKNRSKEMGMTGETGLACLGHSELVTPILAKLRLHIQSYVDAEEFHIMPLHDCDVLLVYCVLVILGLRIVSDVNLLRRQQHIYCGGVRAPDPSFVRCQLLFDFVSLQAQEVVALIKELAKAAAATKNLTFDTGIEARLCAYARSVAHFPAALKEFEWRNGWFYELSKKATESGLSDPCPLHTSWLKELGAI
ncbi:hypothetical protein L7F22_022328 [Adiantum nelumboides]|nr:hypothetical protein [Adiantum nelumboides]